MPMSARSIKQRVTARNSSKKGDKTKSRESSRYENSV